MFVGVSGHLVPGVRQLGRGVIRRTPRLSFMEVRLIDLGVLVFHPAKEALAAVGRRLGTAFSAFLVAQGAPPELSGQLLLALGAVAGVSVDIALAIYSRRKLKVAMLQAAEVKVARRHYGEQGAFFDDERNSA